jgi:hypothetical protein
MTTRNSLLRVIADCEALGGDFERGGRVAVFIDVGKHDHFRFLLLNTKIWDVAVMANRAAENLTSLEKNKFG